MEVVAVVMGWCGRTDVIPGWYAIARETVPGGRSAEKRAGTALPSEGENLGEPGENRFRLV
jgi:hypothetical protein